jgi:hypothetical protein
MTRYSIVNATVVRRKRDAVDKELDAQERRKTHRRRAQPELSDQVTAEFRNQRAVGRTTRGSTR